MCFSFLFIHTPCKMAATFLVSTKHRFYCRDWRKTFFINNLLRHFVYKQGTNFKINIFETRPGTRTNVNKLFIIFIKHDENTNILIFFYIKTMQYPTNHSREDLKVELVENSQLILVLLSRGYLVCISRIVDHLSL